MHILFITPNFPPEVNAGATRTFEHCRRWVRAGHTVTVIAPAPNWPNGVVYEGYRNTWSSRELVDGIQVVRVWTVVRPNKGFFGRTLSFMSFMLMASLRACLTSSVDVVVATSPNIFSGFAGMLTRWFTRRPFVLEVRDIWPESIVAVGAMRTSLLIRVLEWLEKRMYASAAHIVTLGDGYRQQLLKRGVPANKMTVVTNAVDLQQWHLRRPNDEWRRRLDSVDKFVCSYVGTVGMAHGLEVVLRAASQLQDSGRLGVVFWIVGDGATRAALEQESQRRGLRNVRFTGLLPKEQVPDIIATSDACLVHLRGIELFGTVIPSKIFETMALETPIIMGVPGRALEIVSEADAGMPMTPDDAECLVECIDQLRSNRTACRGGRDYVARFFDRDKLADDMLTVLAEHAGKQRAGTSETSPQLQVSTSEGRSRKAA